MKNLFFIINLILMWSIFGCGKKKAASNEANVWLEKNFPQQFEIIDNKYAVNTWISTDRSKFRMLLALKSDPEIQFSIPWNTTSADGGNSIDAINESLKLAKSDVNHSRELLKIFKTQGADKISIGISEAGDTYYIDILFYANPTPDQREQFIRIMQNALKSWKPDHKTNIWFCFMEEIYFGKDFNEIMPSRFVHEWPTTKSDNCTFWFEMEWDEKLTTEKIRSKLQVNVNGQRALTEYRVLSFNLAKIWAKNNYKHKIYLRDNGTTLEPNEKNQMAIDYCIPYFLNEAAATAEPTHDEKIDGYVCGTYHVDEKTFINVKVRKELE